MARTTAAEVKELAPDRVTFAAAKKLAIGARWPVLGQTDDVLWGVYQGSGEHDRHRVYIDYYADVFECNCKVDRRPCKHALALLLLDAADHPMPEAEPPPEHKYAAENRYFRNCE